ncbi:hypothetical protein BH20BAC1_BH20BAC1_08130 [soil metagenome]
MTTEKEREEFINKMQAALDKAIEKLIAEEKARDGYLVVSDRKGGVKKIPARDL